MDSIESGCNLILPSNLDGSSAVLLDQLEAAARPPLDLSFISCVTLLFYYA